jgi:hypothetical protein
MDLFTFYYKILGIFLPKSHWAWVYIPHGWNMFTSSTSQEKLYGRISWYLVMYFGHYLKICHSAFQDPFIPASHPQELMYAVSTQSVQASRCFIHCIMVMSSSFSFVLQITSVIQKQVNPNSVIHKFPKNIAWKAMTARAQDLVEKRNEGISIQCNGEYRL